MAQMYAYLASLAQSVGVIYFMVMFAGICVYALWPRNGERFRRAAHLPLTED